MIETAHLRQSPGFIIIGAQKGGTTSLYHYLTEHPDVGTPLKKEIHYFDFNVDKGPDWYLAHFPLRGEAVVVGEASPSYLPHPDAPGRLYALLPEVKLIALLRHPVDRAYSHHQMNVRKGVETLPFEEAIAREPERLADGGDPSSSQGNWRFFSYLSRGFYAEQLERWLTFFPRENMLIIKSEDLYEEPGQIYNQTLEFLGLRAWNRPGFENYKPGEYNGLNPETRARLIGRFAPHNARLYDLLGRNFGWDDGE